MNEGKHSETGLTAESPTARASAREKLTRLTKLQFQELSTDVYDELMRRTDIENGAGNNGASGNRKRVEAAA